MKGLLRTIATILLVGSAGGMVLLPSLFRQARENATIRGFTAFLLVALFFAVVGGLELWQLRRRGRIPTTVALAMLMLSSLSILMLGGGNTMTVVRLFINGAMIAVLLSPSAQALCRE